jgi:hypothetical protein
MTNRITIQPKGGNQYLVTINNHSKIVDMDGFTIITNSNRDKLELAGLLADDMISPSMGLEVDRDDAHGFEALNYAANYTGFDADKYIAENRNA